VATQPQPRFNHISSTYHLLQHIAHTFLLVPTTFQLDTPTYFSFTWSFVLRPIPSPHLLAQRCLPSQDGISLLSSNILGDIVTLSNGKKIGAQATISIQQTAGHRYLASPRYSLKALHHLYCHIFPPTAASWAEGLQGSHTLHPYTASDLPFSRSFSFCSVFMRVFSLP
jgi:hypothetical protein